MIEVGASIILFEAKLCAEISFKIHTYKRLDTSLLFILLDRPKAYK